MSKRHELSNSIWTTADLHLASYINGFSDNVRKFFERFDIGNETDKRREFSVAHITDIVREHGDMPRCTDTSKVFGNANCGYNRLTRKRPLRRVCQISLENKERGLDACPDLLDDLQAIDKEQVQAILKHRESKWRTAHSKVFREALTEVDPQAKAVIAKKTDAKLAHKADPKLRDFERALKEIDADPKLAKAEIVRLLQEVTA